MQVGIFDADVYGPSLPSMVSPEVRVMKMDPETRGITPVEYEGVKVVSFGFAGKGSAIMRGPMVAGLIQQLMLTADWGALLLLFLLLLPATAADATAAAAAAARCCAGGSCLHLPSRC